MVFDSVLNSINLKLDNSQIETLKLYADMVIEYNKDVNITGSKDSTDFLIKHILDSLIAYMCFNTSENILDVGCGSGLPSIPLAIVYKDKEFTLCESKNKKAAFLSIAKERLKLNNIKVECKNVYEIKNKFDTITARAFANIKTLIKIYNTLKTKNATLLAYKGKLEHIESEIKESGNLSKYKIDIIPLQADFLEAQRHIVKISSI